MMIVELIELSALYNVIICEGDIDYKTIAPIATHAVHLCNCGTSFDWFNRPDHDDVRSAVCKRTDISDDKKQAIIDNAYKTIAANEGIIPDCVVELNIKNNCEFKA